MDSHLYKKFALWNYKYIYIFTSYTPTIFGILLQKNSLFSEKIFIIIDKGVTVVCSMLLFIILKDKGGKNT